MRFVVAKPQTGMSFGDLFYSIPDDLSINDEFNRIIEDCISKTNLEFNRQIREQFKKEVEAIKETDNQITICIIKEITDYSHELGYPVTLFGEESGTVIMYLIGASNVHPNQIEYSDFSSDFFISDLYKKEDFLTLAIAEPVRTKLQSILNDKFAHIKSNNEIYKRIYLPNYDPLEQVKKLSDLTGVNWFEQQYFDVINSLYIDIYKDMFGEKPNLEKAVSVNELNKLYAYNMCSHNHEKCILYFNELSSYLFRDDFYKVFMDSGIHSENALFLSYRGIWKSDKTGYIKYLEEKNVLPNCLSCFKEFTNIWSKATCMSRINVMLALKWYEIHFPKEYEKVVKQQKPMSKQLLIESFSNIE